MLDPELVGDHVCLRLLKSLNNDNIYFSAYKDSDKYGEYGAVLYTLIIPYNSYERAVKIAEIGSAQESDALSYGIEIFEYNIDRYLIKKNSIVKISDLTSTPIIGDPENKVKSVILTNEIRVFGYDKEANLVQNGDNILIVDYQETNNDFIYLLLSKSNIPEDIRNIERFNTVQDMNNDPNKIKGKYGIVYAPIQKSVTENLVFHSVRAKSGPITLSEPVIITEETTAYSTINFNPLGERYSGGDNVHIYCNKSSNTSWYLEVSMSSYSESGELFSRARYESTDGMNWTLQSTEGEDLTKGFIDYPSPVRYSAEEGSNNSGFQSWVNEFMEVKSYQFGGLYQVQEVKSENVPLVSTNESYYSSPDNDDYNYDRGLLDSHCYSGDIKYTNKEINDKIVQLILGFDSNNDSYCVGFDEDITKIYILHTGELSIDNSHIGVFSGETGIYMELYSGSTFTEGIWKVYDISTLTLIDEVVMDNIITKNSKQYVQVPTEIKYWMGHFSYYPEMGDSLVGSYSYNYWYIDSTNSVKFEPLSVTPNTLGYKACPNQFSLMDSGELWEGVSALGQNKVIEGDGSIFTEKMTDEVVLKRFFNYVYADDIDKVYFPPSQPWLSMVEGEHVQSANKTDEAHADGILTERESTIFETLYGGSNRKNFGNTDYNTYSVAKSPNGKWWVTTNYPYRAEADYRRSVRVYDIENKTVSYYDIEDTLFSGSGAIYRAAITDNGTIYATIYDRSRYQGLGVVKAEQNGTDTLTTTLLYSDADAAYYRYLLTCAIDNLMIYGTLVISRTQCTLLKIDTTEDTVTKVTYSNTSGEKMFINDNYLLGVFQDGVRLWYDIRTDTTFSTSNITIPYGDTLIHMVSIGDGLYAINVLGDGSTNIAGDTDTYILDAQNHEIKAQVPTIKYGTNSGYRFVIGNDIYCAYPSAWTSDEITYKYNMDSGVWEEYCPYNLYGYFRPSYSEGMAYASDMISGNYYNFRADGFYQPVLGITKEENTIVIEYMMTGEKSHYIDRERGTYQPDYGSCYQKSILHYVTIEQNAFDGTTDYVFYNLGINKPAIMLNKKTIMSDEDYQEALQDSETILGNE